MADLQSRDELKAKFKKGKTPSEDDFRNLINASFNQKDDRLRRPPNTPLVVDAEADGEAVRLKFGEKEFTLALDPNGNLKLKDQRVVVPGGLEAGKLLLSQSKISVEGLNDLELAAGKGKKLRTESNVRLNGVDVFSTPDKIGVEGWEEKDLEVKAHPQKRLVLGPVEKTEGLEGEVCAGRISVNGLDAKKEVKAPQVVAGEMVCGWHTCWWWIEIRFGSLLLFLLHFDRFCTQLKWR